MTTLSKKKSNGNLSLMPDLLDDFFGHRFFSPSSFDIGTNTLSRGTKFPAANITETKKEYILDLSVPGVNKNDIKIEVENGVLTISSERKEETNETETNYTRREFSYSSFQRSFQLPENISEDDINAKYENGILKVSIPKSGDDKDSKKAIKVG